MTTLEKYYKAKQDFLNIRQEKVPTPIQLWNFQELLYRIEVLEVLKQFSTAVLASDDMKIYVRHYQIVDAYVENMTKERRLPASHNADIQKQRETALSSLNSIVMDYRKRYANYSPQGREQYQKDIQNTILAVLPAWIQYRNTVNEIMEE